MALIEYILKYIIWAFLVILDIIANVLLLGSPFRTISMRLSFAVNCKYTKPRYKWVKPFAKFVDLLFHNRIYSIEKNHVFESYEAEEWFNDSLWKWYLVTDYQGLKEILQMKNLLTHKGRTDGP